MVEIVLDEVLKRKGISRYELSMETGITYPTIVNWCDRTIRNMRTSTLDTLCSYLNCSVSDIVRFTPSQDMSKGNPQGTPKGNPEKNILWHKVNSAALDRMVDMLLS